jgi:GldM C-terminal domain
LNGEKFPKTSFFRLLKITIFMQNLNMRHSLVWLFLALSCTVFGQKRKTVALHYKTIHDTRFSIGDRISMGEITVVLSSKGKDSLIIPDSLELYRAFVQKNTLMTFKLHMIWRNQGVKFPGRTNYTRDALLDYLNEDGPDANGDLNDSTCYIYGYKHMFYKQKPLLIIELEVIDMQSMNNLNTPVQGTISLPEMNMLYRGYNNIVEFAVSGQYDSIWLVGKGVNLTATGNQYIARISTTAREVSISLYSNYGNDTTEHGVFKYRVSNLPLPTIYWETIPSTEFSTINEPAFCKVRSIYAKYPPEIPLKASFDVGTYTIKVGETSILCNGKSLPEEFFQAFELAEQGTVITLEAIKVKGSNGLTTIQGPFTRVKQSPKGTKIDRSGPTFSTGC